MNLDLFHLNQTYYSKTNAKQNKGSKLLNRRNKSGGYLSAFILVQEMKHKDATSLNRMGLPYLLV